MRRENPDLWLLTDIDWQFFLTLTYSSAQVPDAIRQRKLRAFFAKVAEQFGISPGHLVWCARGEAGDLTARWHHHALLTGLPESALSPQTCFWLMHTWEHGVRGGHARARQYEPALDGAGYVLKDLSGSDAHESAKFGDRAVILTLSEGLQRVLRSLSRVRDRRLTQLQRRLTPFV